jgi:dephospho-CoA kinase
MIIGITGTLGAGKGTVAKYLVDTKGFRHYSGREFFIEEVQKRGLPVNRDTITQTANDLRANHGADYVIKELFARAELAGGNTVVESIRAIAEGEFVKSHGHLWAVDADIRTRYERAVLRGSETDKVSFEKFVADEEREMTSTDPTKQNLAAVRAMADTVFTNNGTQEELFAQVEEALEKLN